MRSLILQTAAIWLLVLTFAFSIGALLRGHNAPGGGFIGGLIAGSGFSLYLLAYGAKALKELIRVKLMQLLALGFVLLFSSGLLSLIFGKGFLSSLWMHVAWANLKVGSPFVFDVGVYLIVFASVLIMMLALEEAT